MILYLSGAIVFLFFVCLVAGLAAGIYSIDLNNEIKKSNKLKNKVEKYSAKTDKLKSSLSWLRNENRNLSGVLSDLLNSNKLTKQELTELLKKQPEKNLEDQKLISSIIRKISTEV